MVEYERAVIEEVYEPDQIVREPIYKYYVDTEEGRPFLEVIFLFDLKQ